MPPKGNNRFLSIIILAGKYSQVKESNKTALEVLHERFEMLVLHTYRDTAPLQLRQQEYLKRRIIQWS